MRLMLSELVCTSFSATPCAFNAATIRATASFARALAASAVGAMFSSPAENIAWSGRLSARPVPDTLNSVSPPQTVTSTQPRPPGGRRP